MRKELSFFLAMKYNGQRTVDNISMIINYTQFSFVSNAAICQLVSEFWSCL